MSVPCVFVELGEVVAFVAHNLRGRLRGLAVDVESENQKDVHQRPSGSALRVLDDSNVAIDHEVAVAVGWRADVDAEFSGNRCGLIPGFGRTGSVRFVGGALLGEGERLVPGGTVAVVHGSQNIAAVANFLSVGEGKRHECKENDL